MAPPSGEHQLERTRQQGSGTPRETEWGCGGAKGDQGGAHPVSGEHQEAGTEEKRIKLRRWERRGQSRQSDQAVTEKGLSLAQPCLLAAVVVPLPLPAKMGLPWLLQFLERAKRLPGVGPVHAVPSLLAFPSPPLLCASHQAWLTLPQPSDVFPKQAWPFIQLQHPHYSCAAQTQHGLQTQGGSRRSHKSKAGNLLCPGLGEPLSSH